jgi:hypothetical protein
VTKPNGSSLFSFHWQERDGPPVQPPVHRGFGSTVLEQVMAEYFEARAKIDFAEAGVSYQVEGSLRAIAPAADMSMGMHDAAAAAIQHRASVAEPPGEAKL